MFVFVFYQSSHEILEIVSFLDLKLEYSLKGKQIVKATSSIIGNIWSGCISSGMKINIWPRTQILTVSILSSDSYVWTPHRAMGEPKAQAVQSLSSFLLLCSYSKPCSFLGLGMLDFISYSKSRCKKNHANLRRFFVRNPKEVAQ